MIGLDYEPSNKNYFNYLSRERQDDFGINWLHLQQRFYDPIKGRFDTQDPVTSEQENYSLYQYSWNSPILRSDPNGDCPDCPNNHTSQSQLQKAFTGHENDIGDSFHKLIGNVLSATDLNDATVMTTNLTRGGNAVNLDGSMATRGDKVMAHLGAAVPFVSGSAVKKGIEFVGERAVGAWKALTGKYEQAHHIIQDAAVKNIPGYKYRDAPNVHLKGKANVVGTEHNIATQTQNKTVGGGTYGAERRVAYRALRSAGVSRSDAKIFVRKADEYFMGELKMTLSTPTNYPKTRVKP